MSNIQIVVKIFGGLMKILYIENMADQRELVRRGLEYDGHTVLLAEGALEGLDLAASHCPDVILLDLWMPEMDGLAAAARLRALPGLERTVLLALTADNSPTQHKRALAAGCMGCLVKTIPSVDLMQYIQPYLDGQRDELSSAELIFYLRENNLKLAEQLQSRVQALNQQLTDLHSAQAGLIRSEQLAATGRLALALAHEINNPLQALQSALEMTISVTDEKDKRGGYLEIAHREMRLIADLVQRLLGPYTLEAAQDTQVDLVSVVQDVVRLTMQTARDTSVRLEAPVAADLHPASYNVWGAYAQFHQLILNLVLNAIEAMPSGGLVRINLSRVGSEITLSVSDNGMGIPAHAHIFEPFYTTKAGGHGIGLYVCWLIAQAYKAKLEGWNNPDGGATFTLKLFAAGS